MDKYFNAGLWFTFQVKPLLRLQQQPQLPSLEASQTTVLPGQSTTASRQHTMAHPTLSPWVQHLKPLRYTPYENLLSTLFEFFLCLVL